MGLPVLVHHSALVQQEFGVLEKNYGVKNRGVKQGFFYVLSQVAMPSVLVEMGFFSNEGDRSRLLDIVFQRDLIDRITVALKRFRDKDSVL